MGREVRCQPSERQEGLLADGGPFLVLVAEGHEGLVDACGIRIGENLRAQRASLTPGSVLRSSVAKRNRRRQIYVDSNAKGIAGDRFRRSG